MGSSQSAVPEKTDDLTCLWCNKPFTDPVTLGCGHRLCRACAARVREREKKPRCRYRDCGKEIQDASYVVNRTLDKPAERVKILKNSSKDELGGDSGTEQNCVGSSCSIANIDPPPDRRPAGTSESGLLSSKTAERCDDRERRASVNTQKEGSVHTANGPFDKENSEARRSVPVSSSSSNGDNGCKETPSGDPGNDFRCYVCDWPSHFFPCCLCCPCYIPFSLLDEFEEVHGRHVCCHRYICHRFCLVSHRAFLRDTNPAQTSESELPSSKTTQTCDVRKKDVSSGKKSAVSVRKTNEPFDKENPETRGSVPVSDGDSGCKETPSGDPGNYFRCYDNDWLTGFCPCCPCSPCCRHFSLLDEFEEVHGRHVCCHRYFCHRFCHRLFSHRAFLRDTNPAQTSESGLPSSKTAQTCDVRKKDVSSGKKSAVSVGKTNEPFDKKNTEARESVPVSDGDSGCKETLSGDPGNYFRCYVNDWPTDFFPCCLCCPCYIHFSLLDEFEGVQGRHVCCHCYFYHRAFPRDTNHAQTSESGLPCSKTAQTCHVRNKYVSSGKKCGVSVHKPNEPFDKENTEARGSVPVSSSSSDGDTRCKETPSGDPGSDLRSIPYMCRLIRYPAVQGKLKTKSDFSKDLSDVDSAGKTNTFMDGLGGDSGVEGRSVASSWSIGSMDPYPNITFGGTSESGLLFSKTAKTCDARESYVSLNTQEKGYIHKVNEPLDEENTEARRSVWLRSIFFDIHSGCKETPSGGPGSDLCTDTNMYGLRYVIRPKRLKLWPDFSKDLSDVDTVGNSNTSKDEMVQRANILKNTSEDELGGDSGIEGGSFGSACSIDSIEPPPYMGPAPIPDIELFSSKTAETCDVERSCESEDTQYDTSAHNSNGPSSSKGLTEARGSESFPSFWCDGGSRFKETLSVSSGSHLWYEKQYVGPLPKLEIGTDFSDVDSNISLDELDGDSEVEGSSVASSCSIDSIDHPPYMSPAWIPDVELA